MVRAEKVRILEELIQKEPAISREAYQLLIENYKKYDAIQKKLINELTKQIKKLEVKIGQNESYIEELEEISKKDLEILKKKAEDYDNIKLKNKQLYYLAQRYESLYLESQFPEYANSITPTLKELLEPIITEYFKKNSSAVIP